MPRREGLKSALKGEALFAIVMMMASSLGFAKALGLAGILAPAEFGRYISLLGIATLISILASFGKVEATIKLYPTLFGRGQGGWIARHALRLWLRLLAVLTVAGAVCAVAASLIWSQPGSAPITVLDLAIVVGLSWLIIGQTLSASLIRATTDSGLIQRFTVLRGGMVLLFAIPTAILSGSWRMTLIAEGIGIIAVLGIGALWLSRVLRPAPNAEAPELGLLAPEAFRGGQALYLATLSAATIPYGGRSVVLFLSGAAVAGAFGLLTLLVQIGIMLAGALAQKLGPQMIRDGSENSLQPRRMMIPIAFLGALSLVALVLSLISLMVPQAAAFWATYGIGPLLLVMVSVHLSFQIYLFLQFALIAVHRERHVLEAALGAALVCYGGFAVNMLADLGLVGYMCAVMAADLFQCLYMGLAYTRFLKRRARQV